MDNESRLYIKTGATIKGNYLSKGTTVDSHNLEVQGAPETFRGSIFNISLFISEMCMVVRTIFSSILQIWYVDIMISRSISESPLDLTSR